jgi:hypothetical protein
MVRKISNHQPNGTSQTPSKTRTSKTQIKQERKIKLRAAINGIEKKNHTKNQQNKKLVL